MMEQANRILTVLEEAGHEAYIIGGAVRDMLKDFPTRSVV